MANFRESVEVLKQAGFAESEIIDIMSDSVDRPNEWAAVHPKNKFK